MENSHEEEIQKHRDQLIVVVQCLEKKTVRLIIRTLSLLASNQDLDSLAVYLPGIDGGDIWDLHNPGLYFAEEIFSNSTNNVHACIPEALGKMLGIRYLTIGYTKDIELAEKIARSAGAKELEIETCPEGRRLLLNGEEQEQWRGRGWRLEGKVARKILINEENGEQSADERSREASRKHIKKRKVQKETSDGGSGAGGRLKANMQYEQISGRA